MSEEALPPTEYLHTKHDFEKRAYTILALGEDTRVVMDATGRYHEPVANALPEFDTVFNMFGVGEIFAVNLIAEIGDVRRFQTRNSLVGFVGFDPCVDQASKILF